MKLVPTRHPEVTLIEPRLFHDERGFFLETFHAERYRQAGITAPFVQDNHSHSRRHVLRGLHYQLRNAQGKLIEVKRGRIFDVAVDVRRGSPHFGLWVGVELDADRHQQLWIPPGFAHGFLVLSEQADVVYKCTAPYDPAAEQGVRWDDASLGIAWPVDAGEVVLSDKDRHLPALPDQLYLPEFPPVVEPSLRVP
ncbi:MAG: dTDP-4-dehydrorhamnose 3,5-epimerase [Candidatus Sericytochromatia bacterium]|nr:dTDP-4-dehydrorhamnose 3,5-epimerase [Candidatus Sericytochromatia bacterium]